MKRLVFPITAAAFLMVACAASADESVVEFQLDESYSALAPAAGEPPLATDEVDHNTVDGATEPKGAVDADVDNAPAVAQDVAPVEAEKKPVKSTKKSKEIEQKAREIPLIETQNDNSNAADVTYVTGGIGDDEKQAIEASKADYNVYVMSASISGAFVGDAHVTISRKNGKESESVLTVVAGPLLYVKLPAGSYVLDANLGDQQKRQAFTINKKGAPIRIHLGWKVSATLSH